MLCGGQRFLGKERGNPGWSVSRGLPIGSVCDTDDTWNVLPSLGGTGGSEKFRQIAPDHRSLRKSKHVKLSGIRCSRRRSTEGPLKDRFTQRWENHPLFFPSPLVAWSSAQSITLPSSEVLRFGRQQASGMWHFFNPKLWAYLGGCERSVPLGPSPGRSH